MAAIMQGTTPSITITIDPDDFQLSNVTQSYSDARFNFTKVVKLK